MAKFFSEFTPTPFFSALIVNLVHSYFIKLIYCNFLSAAVIKQVCLQSLFGLGDYM